MGQLNRTEAGLLTITDPGADKPVLEVKTLQCVHCLAHWVPEPGSGRVRGWCRNCMGPVCGPGCAKCVPAEQMLENIEAGRPEGFTRIIVPGGYGG